MNHSRHAAAISVYESDCPLTISVVLCAYTEKRWQDLLAAVHSVRRQTLSAYEIILVIDHNPRLLQRAQDWLTGIIIVENSDISGLRGARNSGVARARGEVIAFLDDDAIAEPGWLAALSQGYRDARVLGTGGAVKPLWVKQEPAWFPEEFYWVVGCSYKGMPLQDAPVRNPIGANMSFRREVFATVGNFTTGLTENHGPQHAGGCEETELSIRAYQEWPQRAIIYHPRASILHRVPPERACWRYFCRRCFSEGFAKAALAQRLGSRVALASERSHMLHTLPRGIVQNIQECLETGDLKKLVRAGAIVAGLSITALGYFLGRAGTLSTKIQKSLPVPFLVGPPSAGALSPGRKKER